MAVELERALLYARTISHLKLRQIGYYLLRRVVPAPRLNGAERGAMRLRAGVALQPLLAGAMTPGGECEFRFLNVAKRQAGGLESSF